MYQQITDNKSYILPCLTQITANHRKQIVYLAMPPQKPPNYIMPHTDTYKSQATNHTSCQCLTQIPADHGGKKSFISHDKSQVTDRTSCHASHRYQQITGNKSYIISCLTQIPANQRQQIVHLAMPFTDTSDSQTTNRISYHASYRYQQITDNKSYILPCLTQMPANHNNKSATIKSRATNRTSCHASHRCQQITGNKSFILPCLHTYQQITGNKSCILPCLTQIPANERQQIVQLTMLHTDTSKTQATNRASCHASHSYQSSRGNKA